MNETSASVRSVYSIFVVRHGCTIADRLVRLK